MPLTRGVRYARLAAAGCAILLAKPMAPTENDSRRIAEAAAIR